MWHAFADTRGLRPPAVRPNHLAAPWRRRAPWDVPPPWGEGFGIPNRSPGPLVPPTPVVPWRTSYALLLLLRVHLLLVGLRGSEDYHSGPEPKMPGPGGGPATTKYYSSNTTGTGTGSLWARLRALRARLRAQHACSLCDHTCSHINVIDVLCPYRGVYARKQARGRINVSIRSHGYALL
jgi:hypothetical protein